MALSSDLYATLKKVLEAPARVFILTHINPDGDAIGSVLGLYWFLVKRGCNVGMATPNHFPHFLKWMDGAREILDFERNPAKVMTGLRQADLVFLLDCNEPDRLGGIKEHLNDIDARTVIVDHHPDPVDFTDYSLTDTRASSTAELVYKLICDLGGRDLLDRRIGECLFAGIMTDTGCFSYNSSNPETFMLVSELLEKGIDKDRIYSLVYDNYSTERMRLLGHSLKDKMVVLPEFRTAYISLKKQDLRHYSHKTGDTEGFVNYPFTIRDIRITALFLEREDHIKISFRSKGSFKINKFAENYFNGGGHMNAAGGEYFDSMEKTLSRFEKLIEKHADEIRNLP
jgi:phosphoesterase RecJ-like protein